MDSASARSSLSPRQLSPEQQAASRTPPLQRRFIPDVQHLERGLPNSESSPTLRRMDRKPPTMPKAGKRVSERLVMSDYEGSRKHSPARQNGQDPILQQVLKAVQESTEVQKRQNEQQQQQFQQMTEILRVLTEDRMERRQQGKATDEQRKEKATERGETDSGTEVSFGKSRQQTEPGVWTFTQTNEQSKTPRPKTKMPNTFDGSTDRMKQEDWCFRVTQYAKINKYDEETTIDLAVSLLEGQARLWWMQYLRRIGDASVPEIDTWEEFQQALLKEFKDPHHQFFIRSQFSALRQTGSVEQYVSNFRRLLFQLPEMPDCEALAAFTNGLSADLSFHIISGKVSKLDEAIELALLRERCFQGRIGYKRHNEFHGNRGYLNNNNNNYNNNNNNNMSSGVKQQNSSRFREIKKPEKDRTVQAKSERSKSEAVCFFCRRPGHKKPDCPDLRTRVNNVSSEKSNNSAKAGKGKQRHLNGGASDEDTDEK